ncbi:Aldolase-type TIM barrel [Penicillium expansum]|nr:Aldolase-type TIM barrel [Penicillium expansum]KGO58522.1 Aldolase-type TIM barrel [Penicillium expansum]
MWISAQEISQHCTRDDCWVVINDHVWDLTTFAPEHPGGFSSIYCFAGHDATEAYNEVHSTDVITKALDPNKLIGKIDRSSIDSNWTSRYIQQAEKQAEAKPPLGTILNAHDFERVAQDTLSKKAWAFYSSAATDLVSVNANRLFYNRIWFRPRLLRDVKSVSTKCIIQGVESALPVVVAPVALARLANPIGEKGIAMAAAGKGIIHCVPITASFSVDEIVSGIPSPTTTFFFQLYVNKDHAQSESLLRQVWELGIRTLFVTVDAPVPGKREADERIRSEEVISMPMTGTKSHEDGTGSGLTRTTGSFIDSTFCWRDLVWLKQHWPGKMVLKGIQSVEDAQMAVQAGMDGIVLSNHGGRNLDTSPPALLTLLELQRHLPSIFGRTEVYVDGGIRRGTDILKAICLGAKAVLIGRPFLYALNYGQEGVKHLIDILELELQTAMRLVGITDLSQAHPGLVNTQDLDNLIDAMQRFE